MEKQTFSIKETAEQLGLHHDAVYRAAKKGEIPVIRIGGRILVPKAVMRRLLVDPGPQGTAVGVSQALHKVEVGSG